MKTSGWRRIFRIQLSVELRIGVIFSAFSIDIGDIVCFLSSKDAVKTKTKTAVDVANLGRKKFNTAIGILFVVWKVV